MKTLLTTLGISLAMVTNVMAAADNLPVLNEQNIQKFIQILPQYRAITEKYGEDVSPEETIPTASKLWTELNALLNKHGMKMEEFPLLAQKISMGFAALQMEDADMGPMGGMFSNLPQFKAVTADEKALLKKYRAQLESVFGAE